MKTSFIILVIVFILIMLGMTLQPSNPSNPTKATTPPEQGVSPVEWLLSPSGVFYHHTCIEGVKYLVTKHYKSRIEFAYAGGMCNTANSNIEGEQSNAL